MDAAVRALLVVWIMIHCCRESWGQWLGTPVVQALYAPLTSMDSGLLITVTWGTALWSPLPGAGAASAGGVRRGGSSLSLSGRGLAEGHTDRSFFKRSMLEIFFKKEKEETQSRKPEGKPFVTTA